LVTPPWSPLGVIVIVIFGVISLNIFDDDDNGSEGAKPPPNGSTKHKGAKVASAQLEGRQLMLGLNKKSVNDIYDLAAGKKLGEGGCGAVYLARERHGLKRMRVIKVIHKKGGGGMTEWAKDFTALRELDHPAICRVSVFL
jgi:hypothetical protein